MVLIKRNVTITFILICCIAFITRRKKRLHNELVYFRSFFLCLSIGITQTFTSFSQHGTKWWVRKRAFSFNIIGLPAFSKGFRNDLQRMNFDSPYGILDWSIQLLFSLSKSYSTTPFIWRFKSSGPFGYEISAGMKRLSQLVIIAFQTDYFYIQNGLFRCGLVFSLIQSSYNGTGKRYLLF